MLDNKSFKIKLEEFSNNYQSELSPEKVFSLFISDSTDDKKILKLLESKQSTICGTTLKKGNLTFQCLTCANKKPHLFCGACFDINLHQNHVCFLIKDNGFCDCGDEFLIDKNGFCAKHKGYNKIDSDSELTKIPIQLQKKIELFITILSSLYFQKMKKIQAEFRQQSSTLTQIYHLVKKQNYRELLQDIELNFEVADYYQTFYEACYLYKMLFYTINWLITDRLSMTILINQIFQKETENNQSILDNIFDYQVLIETQGPFGKFYIIEKILNKFHKDHNFKLFFYQVLIRKYENLRLFIPRSQNHIPYMQSFLDNLLIADKKNSKVEESIINEFWEELQFYARVMKDLSKLLTDLIQSGLQQFIFQSVSDDLMKYFFSQKQFNKILSGSVKHFNKLNRTTISKKKQVENFGSIYYYNEDKILGTTLDQQIQASLSEQQYQIFTTQEMSFNTIQNIKLSEFILSSMIEQLKKITTRQKLLIEFQYLPQLKYDFFDASYYLKETSDHVLFFQDSLKHTSKYEKVYHYNIINLLFLECYNAIKNHKNTQKSVISKIQEAQHRYIRDKPLKNKQIINRYTRIMLLAFKSDTVLDKIFIFLLSYFYNIKQFQTSQELLTQIQNLFQENLQTLKLQLYKILERCIVSLQAMRYHQNQTLTSVYNGTEDSTFTAPVSYDTAFCRFYLYLFQGEGLKDIKKIITEIEISTHSFQILKMPSTQPQFILECSILQVIFGSEIDMLNICGEFFKDLPADLHLSLAKVIINLFAQQQQVEHENIIQLLREMKIMDSVQKHNNYQFILDICNLDKSKVYLQLKDGYKSTFDKNLMSENVDLLNETLEKVIQKQSSQCIQSFGDGVEWDISYFNTTQERKILKEILQFYSTSEFIDINLSIIQEKNQYFSQACQLLHTQLIAANYFQKEAFLEHVKDVLIKLKKTFKEIRQKNMKQLLNTLIIFIEQLSCQQEKQQGELIKKQPSTKQKYRERFQAKQQNTQFQKNLDEIEVEKVENFDDSNLCAACRQQLQNENVVTPVLIFKKPFIQSFSLLPYTLQNFIKQFFQTNIGIQCCKHKYHSNCMEEYFNQLQIQNEESHLPEWMRLNCPTCKLSCNFLMPIKQQVSACDIQSYNSQIKQFCKDQLRLEDFTDIGQIYYQIMIDLLIQSFVNPKDYEQIAKQNIFQTLFDILQVGITQEKKYFVQIPEDSATLKIMQLVERAALKEINKLQFQESLSSLFQECCYIEIIKILKINFQIESVNEINQIEGKVNQELAFFNNLQKQMESQMENQLGTNFDIFHKRFFPKGCNVCNFFNFDQKMSYDSYICLFCWKQFCKFNCKEKQKFGNLNNHAVSEHNGICVYLKVNSGICILTVSPISHSAQNSLYFDKIGYQVDLQDEKQDWTFYEICLDGIEKLTNIIINNSYHQFLKSSNSYDKEFDSLGMF